MSHQEYVDRRFAELMMRLGHIDNRALADVFVRLSRGLSNQHSCLDLADGDTDTTLIEALRRLSIVSEDGAGTPLVLEDTRLYMQRYHYYETGIARRLVDMNQPLAGASPSSCGEVIGDIFGAATSSDQAVAVLHAIARQLTIIVGGPGTGKTTAVVRLLQALARTHQGQPLSIKLAAPTGKAAMRMKEAIRQSGVETVPEVLTLHRLLGVRSNGREFRYGEHNPMLLDLLIVDEVSMIDLAMMHRLLTAMPPRARLVLLGDPDQLPSVEAGNILGDICKYPAGYSETFAAFVRDALGVSLDAAARPHRLNDAVCRLHQTHRFSPDAGIGSLSRQIRDGLPVTLGHSDEVEVRHLDTFNAQTVVDDYSEYLDLVSAGASAAD
ncbi:MAG TPA: AAA family ATPase, partial [Pseudomonadales bacterium]|nr:AAA family ATPase [Pseudomonadales bacterium]